KDTSTITIKEVTSNFGSTRALSGAEYQSAESRFQNILNGELNKINKFARKMIKEWYNDAQICQEKLHKRNSLVELSQILKKLNELGNTLKFLDSYRITNFTGFTKITKKFDKHNDKVISSSFYITVVIKSFFMSYDMNLLVCILSLCYKHYREVRSGVSAKVHSGEGLGEVHYGEVYPREDRPMEDRLREAPPQMTGFSNLERKNKNENRFSQSGESQSSAASTSPKESVHPQVDAEENPQRVIKHTKYLVKAQDLISAKIEISKYYSIHYHDLKEHELMPPFESFIELISTSKIQNYLTTIYLDDSTFSRYHRCINRSNQPGGSSSQSIRLRCYSYIDAEKESTKTVIQHFNLFEPSCDPNEKYVFAKDVPQEDLKIGCVNDLYNLRIRDSSSSGSHPIQGSDSLQLQHCEKYIREIEKNNLTSCLKSKVNRIHFGDDNLSGYIDENICYWVHTDKGAIHGCEEVDSVEGDHSELDEPSKVKQHNGVPSGSNLHKGEYKTGNEEEITAKEKRKYAYFDYAVIDISVKELSSRDFSFQLNHLGVAKEIWGYSSYLQGISMLYPHRISTAPHWRIYTHPKWAKLNAGEGSSRGEKRKKKETKKKKKEKKETETETEKKEGVAVGVEVLTSKGEAKERQNKKPRSDDSDGSGGRRGTLQSNESNESSLSDEDNDTDLSSSENTVEYTERVEKHRNGKKEERKKGITYTGASARIAHESEVIYRNEIERNKSTSASPRHINLSIDSAGSADCCNNRGSYIRGPYSADSRNNPRKTSPQKEKPSIMRHTLAGENDLYEPLLDPVEETTPSKGNKSSSYRITSFFKKIFFCKNKIIEIKRPKTAVVRVEPKTFFANERTLLQWLNTSVLLSTISITLLNFSNSYGFASGVIMAPVAIFFILYSFHIYLKRAEALINKEPINYTDKVGPGVLVITLTFALSTVVLLNIYSRLKGEA
ncbi:SPX d0main containing protein, partial [Plasmodium cynomolgi strain B]